MNFENPIVLDCENYPNYFLISFKRIGEARHNFELRGESDSFSDTTIKMLSDIFETETTFGFNSLNYDLPDRDTPRS